jgi:predicted metal-dependent hydrolase
VTPHVLTGRTEAERRAERRHLLELEAREAAESERRIRDAWAWAERHRIVPHEVWALVRAERNRLGRPLTLSEVADCVPKPRSTK